MKATLFTCALAALASSALARPQSPPSYGGYSSDRSGSGSNKPNGAGSAPGSQPGGIASPVGQPARPQGGSGTGGNSPSSILPGQSVSSPVGRSQPQGASGAGGNSPNSILPQQNQPQGGVGVSGNSPNPIVPGQSISSPVAGQQQGNQPQSGSGAGSLAPGSSVGGLLPGSNGGVQLPQSGAGALPGQTGSISGAIPGQNGGIYGAECVPRRDAEAFVQAFITILARTNSQYGTPEQTANILLAENFTESSNSILSLEQLSLNGDGLSAHSKQEWIQGFVQHAPVYGEIQTLQIIVDCNLVVWHYYFGKIGSGQYPIKGFDLFHMVRSGEQSAVPISQGQQGSQAGPQSGSLQGSQASPGSSQSSPQGSSQRSQWQVAALDVEFDSIAWGLDENEGPCQNAGAQGQGQGQPGSGASGPAAQSSSGPGSQPSKK